MTPITWSKNGLDHRRNVDGTITQTMRGNPTWVRTLPPDPTLETAIAVDVARAKAKIASLEAANRDPQWAPFTGKVIAALQEDIADRVLP